MAGAIFEREPELAAVRAFLDRPAAGLRAMVLEGEAGIGKSTIWLAALEAARERPFRILSARPAEAERAMAFAVLGDLFAGVEPGMLRTLPTAQHRAIDAALLRAEPDAPVDPRALGVATLSVLSALCRAGPILLAVEDMPWVDPSSTAALAFALRRSLDRPIVMLLTERSGGESSELRSAIDRIDVQRLQIGPLSAGATQQMLLHRLQSVLPRPALLRLHELTGGNPFYALELVRSGAEALGDRRVAPKVPPSLERLVGERLASLDPATRRWLLLVAAHGRLPMALLNRLRVGRGAFETARDKGVVEVAEGVVRLSHPLLASVLYQSASVEERRSAHRRLAAAIVDPVLAGPHLALAAGQPDGTLASSLESAAEVARTRGMAIAAGELAEHALRLTPVGALADRLRRAQLATRAQLEAGDPTRARALAREALALAAPGAPRAEALLLGVEFEEPIAAVELLMQALVEAAGAPKLRSAVHVRLAEVGRMTNGRAWAEQHARAALKLAEKLGDDSLRCGALAVVSELGFERSDPGALGLAREAYRLAVDLSDAAQIQLAGWSIAHQLTWLRRNDEARAFLKRRLVEWGDTSELSKADSLWYLALVELWAGRWSEAEDHANGARAIRRLYEFEDPPILLPLAILALYRGEMARARELSTQALRLGRGMMLPALEAVLGIADLWSGHPREALPRLERVERVQAERGIGEPAAWVSRAEHVEALLQLGRVDDAQALVEGWEEQMEGGQREWVAAEIVRSRGLLAAARSDLDGASAQLEDAVRRHASADDPLGRGRALLALGVVRRRQRQKRAARAALEAARKAFESLGAASFAASARQELARIGGRQRLEGLSPSERRVAELASEGRTNREIASALFVSERTVTSHLTHAYAKLGVRSRTELARRLRTEGDAASAPGSNVPTF